MDSPTLSAQKGGAMTSHLKTKELLQERQLYVGPPEGNEYPL